MNRREILKSGFKKAKSFFWVYLAAVVITGLVSGTGDGMIDNFGLLSRFALSLRSGLFSYESVADKGSEFWNVMLSGNGLLQSSGLVTTLAAVFLSNPLEIGETGLFLSDAPRVEMLWSVFKSNYGKIVKTTFVYNFLLTLALSAITTVYAVAVFAGCMACAGIAYYAETGAVIVAAAVAYTLVLTGVYAVVTVNVSYNFAMIPYIVAENPECGFTECFAKSRNVVKGKKLKIFSIDFVFWILSALSICVPVALIATGIALKITGLGGMSCLIAGLFSIAPVICFNVFVSVFRKSAWAEIYLAMKDEIKDNPGAGQIVYCEAPEPEENISYKKIEADDE